MHHGGEGVGQVGLLLVDPVKILPAVNLLGIGPHRPLQPLHGDHRPVGHGVVEKGAEVGGTLFEQVILAERGQAVAAVVQPQEAKGEADGKQCLGGPGCDLQCLADFSQSEGACREQGKEFQFVGNEDRLVGVYPHDHIPEGMIVPSGIADPLPGFLVALLAHAHPP